MPTNTDKLTAIRIKQQNGQYGPQIPVGAKAENVKYDNQYSVKEVLGNVRTNVAPLQEQIDNIQTETIADTVEAWMDEHADPGTIVVLDDTLTESTMAANAAAAGKLIAINNQTSGDSTKVKFDTTNQIVNVALMEDIPDLTDVITEEYNSAATYAIDDYVLYGGNLYKCIVDIDPADGIFNNNHWKLVKVGSELTNLKNILDTTTGNTTIPFIAGAYINTASNVIDINNPVSYANAQYAIIQCSAGDQFTITVRDIGNAAHGYTFINSNGTVLETGLTTTVPVTDYVIFAPENTEKLILNSRLDYNTICYRNKLIHTQVEEISEYACTIDFAQLTINNGQYIRYLQAPDVAGKSNNSNYCYSNPIYIDAGKIIEVTGGGVTDVVCAISLSDINGTTYRKIETYTQNGTKETIQYFVAESGYYVFSGLISVGIVVKIITTNQRMFDYFSQATENKKVKYLAGVIRNNGTGWAFIDNENHRPMNLSSVSVNANGSIVVDYGFACNKVISLVVTPDETFAANYTVGASVGLDTATINVYTEPKTIGGYVFYNSTIGLWDLSNSTFSSASFNTSTGLLTLSHDFLNIPKSEKFNININGFGINAVVGGTSSEAIIVKFLDSSGNTILSPNEDMKVIAFRQINKQFINANNVSSSSGNFWIFGIVEVN